MKILASVKAIVRMIGRSLSHLGAKAPRVPQFSLRIRFAIGMAAMLLPLVLLVAAGRLYFLPRLTQSLEKVVEEVLEEMVPVVHLQNALLQAAMPANDYLIHGDPAERENFSRLSQEVDQAFEEALAAPYALGEERALLQAAWEEWQQARSLSETILALPDPVGDPLAAQEMERLDVHVDRAVELLDRQHGLAHREAGEQLAAAAADRKTAEFFSGGVFVVALLIAIAASLMLAHSVLAPVRALRQGAIRFGELMGGAAQVAAGDMDVRVQVKSHDELGDLAASFNRMTEELKRSYGQLQAELGARQRAQERLAKLNECLLSFSADPNENINRLVAFCGEQLQATCALYNRLEGDQLRALGQWHTPPDFSPVDKPDGHICYDVIQNPRDDVRVIRDLPHTAYAQTDPNVIRYELRTYVGKAIALEGTFVGSLCVVYQEDTSPSEDDLNLLGIAASAVGVEEKRKRAEEELVKLRKAVETSGEVIFLTDPDGLITYMNPEFTRLYGHRADALVGKVTPRILKSGKLKPEDYEMFWKTLLNKQVVRGEIVNKTQDGRFITVEGSANPILDEQENIVGFLAIQRDITERKRAEEAFERLSRQNELILTSLGEGVYGVDLQGRATFVNPAAVEMLGHDVEELISQPMHEMMHHSKPDGTPYPREGCLTYAASKDGIVHRVTGEVFWRKDGTCFPVEYVSTPLRERDGVVGAVVVFRDITERVRAEQALHRRDAILEAVSFAAEQFLKATAWKENIQEVLARLGQATEVSRVYIFENHPGEDGSPSTGSGQALLTSQCCEWVAPGVPPQIENPDLQNFPMLAGGFARWVEVLGQGELIYGHMSEFPESEREALAAQDIQSIAIVPIFLGQTWWGFIGFDECRVERDWSVVERDALKTAADTLGAALQRQQVEAELQTAEAHYHNLFNTVPVGIYQTTLGGGWPTANPALAQTLGYASLAELLETVADLNRQFYVEPGRRAEFIRRVQEEGSVSDFESQVYRKDGSVIWVSERARGIYDASGQLIGFEGTTVDITARIQAEEALRASEQRFRALTENAEDITAIVEADGTIRYESPSVERALGFAPEKLIGQSAWDFIHPDDLDHVLEVFSEGILTPGFTATVEFRFRHKDGSWRLLEGVGKNLLADPVIAGVVVNSRDITARKQAEQELEHRANEFRTLYETARDLAAQRDLPALLQTIVERAVALLNAASGSIFLYDAARQDLEIVVSMGPELPVGTRYELGEGMAGRVALSHQPMIVDDYRIWEGRSTQIRDIPISASIEVPMLYGGELIGVLAVNQVGETLRKFTDEDARLLSLFAGQAASAVHNARLYAAVQQELAERARYEFIVNTSHELMTLINQEQRYEAVNAAYCEARHKTREELVGRSVAEVWGTAVYQSNIKPYLERCLAGHIERYQEWFSFADAEPRCFDVAYYPYAGQAGTVTHAVVVSHDITELKRAEAALRESETRFKSLFEDSPSSLWEEDFSRVAIYFDELRQSGVTDFRSYFENHPEGVAQCATMVKVVDVNKATLKLYQAKSKEALLAGLTVVLSEEGFPTFREELIAIAEGKTRFESEVINQTLRGERIHIALSWSVAPGYEETSSKVFVSINDITERRQAEEALRQANEKLTTSVTALEQHSNEITLLNEMGDLLQTCHTVVEAGTVVAQFAQKLFPNQSGALCVTAASRNFVETLASWGESPPPEHVFTPDDCWALRRGQVHRVADPNTGLLCKHVSPPLANAYLCVPMMAQGETLGVLHLQSSQPPPSRTPDGQAAVMSPQQQLAVTLAEHIALALANLRLRDTLRHQAIRDPLTDLFNRRYMEETLARELRRAERRQVPLAIILFDLDHFKKFNDTLGHAAGDVVLREIGAFLQTRVRAEDIACRYGGEEFIVILPEAPLEDTLKRAEQLRVGIKQLHLRYHDQALGAVTVSLGVAIFPEHGSLPEVLLRAADGALYRAKREGRDRVVTASGESA